MLFLDGVYIADKYGTSRFRRVNAPSSDELLRLTHTIAHRVGRYLERRGLLERDAGNTYLTQASMFASEEDRSNHLSGSSITYRIALGPQQGRKVMTLQTLADCGDDPLTTRVGHVAGFSLHAGVAAKANERAKLERLCRYITRPAIATKRLSFTRNGRGDKCGGDVRIIASIQDPAVIRTLLAYLDKKRLTAADNGLPDCRASPGASLDLLIAAHESKPGFD